MFESILVPLDGSELSEKSLIVLEHILSHSSRPCKLCFLRVLELPNIVALAPGLAVPSAGTFNVPDLQDAAREYLEKKATAFSSHSVETKVLIGSAADLILELGKDYSLTIIASHGLGGLGRWLLGSVASKVLHASEFPILMVGGKCLSSDDWKPYRMETVVVGLDGSDVSERAFQSAYQLAQNFDSKLVLYRAVSQVELKHQLVLEANKKELDKAQEYLRGLSDTATSVSVETEVKESYGEVGIVTFAKDRGADLLVMGSHGKGGFKRWLLGSETENALRNSHCPVLVTH